MSTDLKFFVHGIPAPQGSKRHVGNGRMIESSKKVGPWRDAVIDAASQFDAFKMLNEALAISIMFTLPAPKTTKRLYPTVRPDVDKLLRSTFDALTISGFWHDDSLVVSVLAAKRYAAAGEPLGALIEVSTHS
jgi:crossover junction endodeoxyribonuclease RusA